MRTVVAIFLIFLVRFVHLHPIEELNVIGDVVGNIFNDSCIFGPKSMSMVLFNSDNPKGKNIGQNESCSNIDPSKPIMFLVHGFTSYANTTNSYNLASRAVENGYTVFSLDWSKAACRDGIPILRLLEYPQAVKNTREIGELMAKYVTSLIEECKEKVSLDNITFVGHSLGAHVSGFAAKHIQESGFGTIPRIFGADPAEPMFGLNDCSQRLCKTDATHVIVLHTSILGIPYSLGEIDLQFNGGKEQPDCLFNMDISCSHSKSMTYLANLFDNCVYPGVPTSSSIFKNPFNRPSYPTPDTTDCIVITDKIFDIKSTDKVREGNYYVFVEKKPPYCTQKLFSCNSLTITA